MNSPFLSPQNIRLLWDLLTEEPSVSDLPKNKQELVYNSFIQNIQTFHKMEMEQQGIVVQDNVHLVALNKKFLTIMLKIIKNEPLQEPQKKYKIEDIQTERQKLFDAQLAQRRNEFEQFNNPKKPPVPNFADTLDNEKIKNIDELISQTISQRNFDIQPLKYIQIQEPINTNINKEIIDLSPIQQSVQTVGEEMFEKNEKNILEKLKIVKPLPLKEELDLNGKIELLEQKIDNIYQLIKNMSERIPYSVNTN